MRASITQQIWKIEGYALLPTIQLDVLSVGVKVITCRVLGMAGKLIYACPSAPPKVFFFYTVMARLWVISPGETVMMSVPSGEP